MMLLGTGTWPLFGPADLFLGIAPFSQPTGTCSSWDRALQLHYLIVQYLKRGASVLKWLSQLLAVSQQLTQEHVQRRTMRTTEGIK